VDDLVQATLVEVVASTSAPRERPAWNLWVFGIARHKLADFFRERSRVAPLLAETEIAAAPEAVPPSARELLRWAERELPEGEHAQGTLEALLEEADGEALEELARTRAVPAARLRQRVARLRRHFRTRWALQVAAIGSILGVVVLVWWRLQDRVPTPTITAEVLREVAPGYRARALRRAALEECGKGAFDECVRGLDAAKRLDAAGDAATDVVEARRAAQRALEAPTPTPSNVAPLPSSSSTPLPSPRPTERRTPRSTGTGTPSAPPAPRGKASGFGSGSGP
jgi:DNA-directed RNA polymerase specialized sigma24 family protein